MTITIIQYTQTNEFIYLIIYIEQQRNRLQIIGISVEEKEMSQSIIGKGNKISFDQYHSKLFNKVTNGNIKINSNKSQLKESASNKLVSNAGRHHQPTFTSYHDSKPNHHHTKSLHQANHPTKPLHPHNSQPITLPISHTLHPPLAQKQQHKPQPLSSQSQMIRKIDLIFEKQPQQVQNKLRMLLLNYNAVMEYNQDEDRFEVDLLLPFQSVEEQQAFVQRFQKTRKQIKQQLSKSINDETHLVDSSSIINQYQPQQQSSMCNIDQQQQQQKDQQQIQLQNDRQDEKKRINNQFIIGKQKNNENINTVSYSRRQSCVDNSRLEKEEIDLHSLDESLDGAIKRGMELIRGKLIVEQKHYGERLFQSNKEREQTQFLQQQHSSQQQIPDHPTTPQPHQSTYTSANKSHSPYLSNNKPYDSNNFYPSYPSGQQQPQHNQQKSQLFDMRNSDYILSSQQSTMRVQGMANLVYNNRSNDCYNGNRVVGVGGGNVVYSNGMLIDDDSINGDDDDDDVVAQSLQYNQSLFNDNYPSMSNQLRQQPIIISVSNDDDDDDMIMIEQTSDEDNEEQQQEKQFISPKDYQHFLKKKLNSLATVNGTNTQHQYHHHSQSPATNNRRYSPAFSSFRKDYTQFLKKNHKRIEKLYLRIGKQLNAPNKRIGYMGVEYKESRNKRQEMRSNNSSNGQEEALGEFRRRIIVQNQQMSSQDKVRYFRYLAKNAKRLYLQHIKSQAANNKINITTNSHFF